MSRKRKVSSLLSHDDDEDDEDYCEEKYSKDQSEGRAPRNAANARERARMRVLSKAFCRLKKTIPWVPADTKLSKLDTLRLALSYITQLRSQLNDDVDQHPDSTKQLSLSFSWPFSIQATNQSVFMNNSCAVSSTSSTSSTDINQYNQSNNQVQQELQNYHQANNHSMPNHHEIQHQHHHQHHERMYY